MGWYLSHVVPPLVAVLVTGAALLQALDHRQAFTWPLVGLALSLALLADGLRRARARLRAMDALVAAAIELARGQYGAQLPVRGRGEIAGLLHTFNYLSRRLAERHGVATPEATRQALRQEARDGH